MKTQAPTQRRQSESLPKLLTTDELAESLGLTRRGVETMTKRRVLPVIKLSNRAVRYNPVAVQAALDRLTIESVSASPAK